ncbi:hypothetical protein DIPPA_15484 [Diplonema papillatum]|nr:hypothetical protein DIPPA_15484 [Diplonema papillatum]
MSIYAKMVEAPTTGGRAFMNLGGALGSELDGDQSFFFGYVHPHGQLFAKFAGSTGIVIDSDWHHYAVTYNGSTVRIYFDEQEAATADIALDLVESLGSSTMMIGDINFGNTPVARDGVWLFDEAVFGRGVLGFDVLSAPCVRTGAFSRYPLDGDFLDTAPAGNSNLVATFTPADDSVCGGSLRVEKGEFFTFRNPNEVPTGSEPWTMSIYAKMVEAPTTGTRAFVNLGGGDGIKGFWFGYGNGQLSAKFGGTTGIIIDSHWHHYAATYNGSTLRIYFDEQEVASVDVALDLVEASKHSTMMIGEKHSGNTPSARDGVWLFDEAVFGRRVLGFDVLRAPCVELFSRYPLDGDFLDTALAGNSLAATFTPAVDSVCGGSLRVEQGEFFAFRNPNGVPTGSESWTMSIYAKMVEAPTTRMRVFMNLGGDGSNGNEGFWFGFRSGKLVAKFTGTTAIVIDSDWHHYTAAYNGRTLRIYFDEQEVASVDVALDLVESSKYSTMTIGETHFGSTPVAREGVWLFDEAVFGRGILSFAVLRVPCVPNAPVESPQLKTKILRLRQCKAKLPQFAPKTAASTGLVRRAR